jgi:hypothetical protein
MAFLTAEQFQALGAAIQKARAARGIHRVLAPDGEVFAYQFNGEVYWHVHDANNAKVAQGIVPLSQASAA